MVKPKRMDNKLKIIVNNVVKYMLSPVMLAPIPKPKLFIVKPKARIIDSFISIYFKLSFPSIFELIRIS